MRQSREVAERTRRGISPDAYRRWTMAALVALCGIVVTGAAVRLTGSGLGCSDWPTCEENRLIAPLEFHAMVEFVNRVFTGFVSVAVIGAVAGSLLRRPRRPDLTRWSLALVAGVVAQIVIGALVVLSELDYSMVALHFLVSMVLVWAAVVLHHRAGRPDDAAPPAPWPALVRAMVALAALLLVTGSVVTSAGPHAGDEEVERLPFDIGWTVRVHSVVVWTFLAVTVLDGLRSRRRGDAAALRDTSDLLAVAVAQGTVGYLQYFSDVPPLLVGLHVVGATLVWVLTVRLALRRGDATAAARAEQAVVDPVASLGGVGGGSGR